MSTEQSLPSGQPVADGVQDVDTAQAAQDSRPPRPRPPTDDATVHDERDDYEPL